MYSCMACNALSKDGTWTDTVRIRPGDPYFVYAMICYCPKCTEIRKNWKYDD